MRNLKNVITTSELVELLMNEKGATFIGLTAVTDPSKKMYASSPYRNKISKVGNYNVLVNFDYDSNVENALIKEGKDIEEFKKGTSWHEPIFRNDGTWTPLCSHKKTKVMYLRLRVLKSETAYIDNKGNYIDVPKDHFYPTKSYENQGLENAVAFITMSLENVTAIRINKNEYKVV